jgi:hypothetical protein
MYENLLTSLKTYDSDVTIIFNKEGNIDNKYLPKYFVLECPICKDTIKVNFVDHFMNEQLKLMEKLSTIRANIALKESDLSAFNEDSGHIYCGYCEGPFDSDGYCNKGFMEKCIVRGKRRFV